MKKYVAVISAAMLVVGLAACTPEEEVRKLSVSEHLTKMGVSSHLANSPYAPQLMEDICDGLDSGLSIYDAVQIAESASVDVVNASKIVAVAMARECPEYIK